MTMTGAELEKRFSHWRERRKQQTSAKPSKSRTGPGIITAAVVGVVVVLAGAVALMVVSFGAQEELDRLADQISIVEASLRPSLDSQQTPDMTLQRTTELIETMDQARLAAQAVADAQQGFAQIYYDIAMIKPDEYEIDEQNKPVIPQVWRDRLPAHGLAVGQYFHPSSFLVDSQSQEYLNYHYWVRKFPFGPDEMDPRFPWLTCHTPDGYLQEPGACSWSVLSVTPFVSRSGEPTSTLSARVVWQDVDTETGVVLAWAEATYCRDEAGTGLFNDMKLTLTSFGVQREGMVR